MCVAFALSEEHTEPIESPRLAEAMVQLMQRWPPMWVIISRTNVELDSTIPTRVEIWP